MPFTSIAGNNVKHIGHIQDNIPHTLPSFYCPPFLNSSLPSPPLSLLLSSPFLSWFSFLYLPLQAHPPLSLSPLLFSHSYPPISYSPDHFRPWKGWCDTALSRYSSAGRWLDVLVLMYHLSWSNRIVFTQPRVQYFHMPPPLVDTEQLDCCKLLGVILQSNFKMDSHIQFILSQCAQRLYLLILLSHQGLPDAQLSVK